MTEFHIVTNVACDYKLGFYFTRGSVVYNNKKSHN